MEKYCIDNDYNGVIIMFTLKGAYAPIPTPFYEDEIAYSHLKENLDKWAESNLEGLVVCGSNGEFPLLDEQEKADLFAFVRRNFPANRPVIAGTGCESLKATIRLTKQAAEVGINAALVVTPWYYKGAMKDDSLKAYYSELADLSPIPIILYNMPRNTGVEMNVGLVSELSYHPNIIGIKDSSGNIVQIADIINKADKDFAVFAGSGSFLYSSLVLGATGATMAVANIIPNLCDDIIRLQREGQHQAAKKLQLDILDINAAVTSKWGIAGLKTALDMIGYYGGPLRKPLQSLNAEAKQNIKIMLGKIGII